MEKIVAVMKPLAEIGNGRAEITDNSVLIEVTGINGSLKAWLTGENAVPIGNIVGGRLMREIDTTAHNGILITQSGRQMLYTAFRQGGEATYEMPPDKKAEAPFTYGDFKWKKITQKGFASQNNAVKFILSNKKVYENFKRNGFYHFGESAANCAIALKCDGTDDNPFSFLAKEAAIHDGCRVICINTDEKKLYTL